MEFVIVSCGDELRTVFIDNQEQGETGRRLSVPEGLHVFDLGAPVDYAPPSQELLVEGTTPNDPLPVVFTLIETREEVPVVRKRARKRARKRPATRRTLKRASGKKGARKTKGRRTTAGRKRAAGRKKR